MAGLSDAWLNRQTAIEERKNLHLKNAHELTKLDMEYAQKNKDREDRQANAATIRKDKRKAFRLEWRLGEKSKKRARKHAIAFLKEEGNQDRQTAKAGVDNAISKLTRTLEAGRNDAIKRTELSGLPFSMVNYSQEEVGAEYDQRSRAVTGWSWADIKAQEEAGYDMTAQRQQKGEIENQMRSPALRGVQTPEVISEEDLLSVMEKNPALTTREEAIAHVNAKGVMVVGSSPADPVKAGGEGGPSKPQGLTQQGMSGPTSQPTPTPVNGVLPMTEDALKQLHKLDDKKLVDADYYEGREFYGPLRGEFKALNKKVEDVKRGNRSLTALGLDPKPLPMMPPLDEQQMYTRRQLTRELEEIIGKGFVHEQEISLGGMISNDKLKALLASYGEK